MSPCSTWRASCSSCGRDMPPARLVDHTCIQRSRYRYSRRAAHHNRIPHRGSTCRCRGRSFFPPGHSLAASVQRERSMRQTCFTVKHVASLFSLGLKSLRIFLHVTRNGVMPSDHPDGRRTTRRATTARTKLP